MVKGKKTTRKQHKKGGYYSFSGGIAPGAANWSRQSEMGDYAVSSRGGNTQYGRGRKHKKGKARKTRRLRGGEKYGAASASYQGTGERGIIDVVGVSTKGYADSKTFNDYGAKPGDFTNFSPYK